MFAVQPGHCDFCLKKFLQTSGKLSPVLVTLLSLVIFFIVVTP